MADQGAADWGNLQNVFGLQPSDINNLKSQGYSADQASQLLALSAGSAGTGPVGGAGTAGTGQLPQTIGGSGLSPQTLVGLASVLGRGGGGGGGDTPGGNLRNYKVVGVDPNQPFTNLGAAALNQNAIYNPQPGAGTGGNTGVTGSGGAGFAGGGGLTIGGISTTTPAITTSGQVPKPPIGPWSGNQQQWTDVGTQVGLSPKDIATFQQQGLSPSDVASKFGVQVNTQPGVPSIFNRAPTVAPSAPSVTPPTVQPTGMAYQPGQAWATPPPAPTLNLQGVPSAMSGGAPSQGSIGAFAAAHNSALADAGQALFAHFGGDPSSASPADIAHFHTQLTGAIPALQTGGGGGKEPIKMQSGGRVPNPEIPRGLPGGGGASQYYGMGANGSPQANQGFEASEYPPPQQQPQQQQRPRPQRPQQTPAAQRSSAQDYADWANQGRTISPAQQYADMSNWANAAKGGGGGLSAPSSGFSGLSSADQSSVIGGGFSSGGLESEDFAALGRGGPAGPIGGGAGAGGGAGGAADVIGGLASGLSKAAETYAASIKPWQMQKSAIPNPDDFRKQPQITLQQPGLV